LSDFKAAKLPIQSQGSCPPLSPLPELYGLASPWVHAMPFATERPDASLETYPDCCCRRPHPDLMIPAHRPGGSPKEALCLTPASDSNSGNAVLWLGFHEGADVREG